MDLLQAIAWIAPAVGVIVTAASSVSELKMAREQRTKALRWRQAETGKALNDEMQTDQNACSALQMLDSDRREYSPREGQTLTITREDVRPRKIASLQPNKLGRLGPCVPGQHKTAMFA